MLATVKDLVVTEMGLRTDLSIQGESSPLKKSGKKK